MNILNNQDYLKLKNKFNDSKKPYRYVIIDNFFDEVVANKLLNTYPADGVNWYKFRDKIGNMKNVLEQGMYGISDVKNIHT